MRGGDWVRRAERSLNELRRKMNKKIFRFLNPYYLAIYQVKDEGEWPLWYSLSTAEESTYELWEYWANDLPDNMKADRKLVKVVKIHIQEVE